MQFLHVQRVRLTVEAARVTSSKKHASKTMPPRQCNSVLKNTTEGALKKLKVSIDKLPFEKVEETIEQGPVQALCREILRGDNSFLDLVKHQGKTDPTESKMNDDEDEEEVIAQHDSNIADGGDHGDNLGEKDPGDGLGTGFYDVYEYEGEHEDDEDDSDYHEAYCGYGDDDDENDSDYQDVHDGYGLENDDDDEEDEQDFYDA